MQLSVFNFNGHNVRTVLVDGVPYWGGPDVCAILGYANVTDAIKRHCRPGGVAKHDLIDSLGRPQSTTIINEGNVCRLIAKSNMPNADAFESWIFDEVVPTIFKTGAYRHPDSQPAVALDPTGQLMAMIAQNLTALTSKTGQIDATIEEQGIRIAAVEERQRVTDPREIETRMFELHRIKRDLVEGTKGSAQPVTHPAYWRSLKEHCRIGSFQHRGALDVPLLERAITFARNWCFERGLRPPTSPNEAAA